MTFPMTLGQFRQDLTLIHYPFLLKEVIEVNYELTRSTSWWHLTLMEI